MGDDLLKEPDSFIGMYVGKVLIWGDHVDCIYTMETLKLSLI